MDECVMCGDCCEMRTCAWGEGSPCKFLGKPRRYGKRKCGKYREILATEAGRAMMSTGCPTVIRNDVRDRVIRRMDRAQRGGK